MKELQQDYINLLNSHNSYIDFLNIKGNWRTKCLEYLKLKKINGEEYSYLILDNYFQNKLLIDWWNEWNSVYTIVKFGSFTKSEFKNKYIKSNYFNALNNTKQIEMINFFVNNKIIEIQEAKKIYKELSI
jgi:hypothetical protein